MMPFLIFEELMTVYTEQIEKPNTEQLWAIIGGDKKGYLTLEELTKLFDKAMPRSFDRDLAFEMFREIDSDKDGRLSYKDFYECMKFQL